MSRCVCAEGGVGGAARACSRPAPSRRCCGGSAATSPRSTTTCSSPSRCRRRCARRSGGGGARAWATCGNQFHYYRLTADGRILWGGYDAVYRYGGPVEARLDEHDATFAKLSQHFFATFPQLEGLRFAHRWGGAIDTCSRFSVFFGTAHGGRVAYAAGYTGLGVGRLALRRPGRARPARRARDRGDPRCATCARKPVPFPPEPLRSAVIQLTRNRLAAADRNEGAAASGCARSTASGSASTVRSSADLPAEDGRGRVGEAARAEGPHLEAVAPRLHLRLERRAAGLERFPVELALEAGARLVGDEDEAGEALGGLRPRLLPDRRVGRGRRLRFRREDLQLRLAPAFQVAEVALVDGGDLVGSAADRARGVGELQVARSAPAGARLQPPPENAPGVSLRSLTGPPGAVEPGEVLTTVAVQLAAPAPSRRLAGAQAIVALVWCWVAVSAVFPLLGSWPLSPP